MTEIKVGDRVRVKAESKSYYMNRVGVVKERSSPSLVQVELLGEERRLGFFDYELALD